jgi:TetR/AcrR family transcriptional regulator, cholesterol catabolism regulator
VAERSDVALGTLYRYFPSKIHLLVSALARELARTQDRTARTAVPGETPFERSMFILSRMTKAMQRDPQLTEAMTRAFMFADATAAAEVDTVGRLMDRMIARALTDAEPNDEQLAIARVISDVWLSNLVAWVTRRASAQDVATRLELTISLLLGHRNGAEAF